NGILRVFPGQTSAPLIILETEYTSVHSNIGDRSLHRHVGHYRGSRVFVQFLLRSFIWCFFFISLIFSYCLSFDSAQDEFDGFCTELIEMLRVTPVCHGERSRTTTN